MKAWRKAWKCLFWLTALEFLLVYHCVVCKIRETLIVENEKKNLLSKVLVISWEKHLRKWCTDLVWLRRILLLEDTSIEEQNSSCRKCDRSSWDVKSISYGTYLILAKNKKYVAGEETRPLRGGAHLAKKNSYPARCEKQVTEWKTTCISLETKKRDVRRKRETRPLARNEKRETRNATYLMKNGTSQEMYGISRETWWFPLRKLGNFNNI